MIRKIAKINGGSEMSGNFNVAVVIPLYNKEEFVRSTIESVLRQSVPAQEILVIDDGSTDDGPAIIERLRAKQVRIVRQRNTGPGAARNRGIEEAKQPWVAFLDADDLWLPNHLAHLGALHRAFPDAMVLASGYTEFRAEPPQSAENNVNGKPFKLDFFTLDPGERGLSSSSVAVKACALRAAGGFGAEFPGEDVDLWIRLGLEHPVVKSTKVTALYRRANEGLTQDYLSSAEPEVMPIIATIDAALADSRYLSRHKLISRYRDRWMLLLARQALARLNMRQARACLREVSRKDVQWLFLATLATMPAAILRGALKARKRPFANDRR